MSKAKPGSERSLPHPGEYLKKGILKLPKEYKLPEHKHQEEFATLRESCYRGKEIRIETTYRIMIDNQPLTVHTSVSNDGSVHCHSLPNYSFPSAIEMVRRLVDRSFMDVPENQLVENSSHNSKEGN